MPRGAVGPPAGPRVDGASRQPRRVRGSLSRDEILAAGLRIAREDDLRRLTMQRLGKQLGVTGMALYRHFRNKQELVDGILDHFAREAAVTAHATDRASWRLWLRRTCHGMYGALADAPGVIPFVATSSGWRFGPAALATMDEALAVLREAGFEPRLAVEIYTTLLALVVGFATLGGADAPTRVVFEHALDRTLDALDPH